MIALVAVPDDASSCARTLDLPLFLFCAQRFNGASPKIGNGNDNLHLPELRGWIIDVNGRCHNSVIAPFLIIGSVHLER
jgi:hypothetical protein